MTSVRKPEPAPPPAAAKPVVSLRKAEPAPPPQAPEPISVSINATPWAIIEIDGKEIGETPMANVLLAPGDHRFRARMSDGTVMERTIRITPDNRHIAFAR